MTPMLVDVHSHIHGVGFDEDRAPVLEQAERCGVRFVLAMGEGFADNQRVLEVASQYPVSQYPVSQYPVILPCLGLHPDRAAKEPVEPVIQQIRQHAARLAAVGEVGLDYWIAKEPEAREQQRDALSRLAALALELDLPLSVHSRSAGHHSLGLLHKCGARRVCMHAFDGAAKHAARAVEMGYFLSIPPSVVRSPQKQKLVQRVPLESLMLETDSPVLGPEREQRNVPANVTVAAEKIAEIKGCDLEQVLRVTSDNACRFFGLERF